MLSDNRDIVKKIEIDINSTIKDALQLMDDSNRKLLLVIENNKFKSLLSIGDLQRALLKNADFETPIIQLLRKNISVCKSTDDKITIRNKMLELRAECMPIIDNNNELIELYFWEDFFPSEKRIVTQPIDNPVVIMAGGLGTRLKPLTNVIPKPLVPVGDKTIIEIIIDKFVEIGIHNFFATVNYKHEMMKFYFDQLQDKHYAIDFYHEKKPLGTAGSLQLLENKIEKTFFVNNCDILIDQDYRDILDYHNNNDNEITLVAAIKNYNIPYGIVESGDDGLLLDIKEKPEFNYMINSGMYVLEPHLLSTIPKDKFYHITNLIDDVRNRGGRVGVFPVTEKSWFDIGEWSSYQKTLIDYDKRFCINSI